MIFYITKHAITHGIIAVEGEYDVLYTGMIEVKDYNPWRMNIIQHFYIEGEYFTDANEAVAQARKMREAYKNRLMEMHMQADSLKFNLKRIKYYTDNVLESEKNIENISHI